MTLSAAVAVCMPDTQPLGIQTLAPRTAGTCLHGTEAPILRLFQALANQTSPTFVEHFAGLSPGMALGPFKPVAVAAAKSLRIKSADASCLAILYSLLPLGQKTYCEHGGNRVVRCFGLLTQGEWFMQPDGQGADEGAAAQVLGDGLAEVFGQVVDADGVHAGGEDCLSASCRPRAAKGSMLVLMDVQGAVRLGREWHQVHAADWHVDMTGIEVSNLHTWGRQADGLPQGCDEKKGLGK